MSSRPSVIFFNINISHFSISTQRSPKLSFVMDEVSHNATIYWIFQVARDENSAVAKSKDGTVVISSALYPQSAGLEPDTWLMCVRQQRSALAVTIRSVVVYISLMHSGVMLQDETPFPLIKMVMLKSHHCLRFILNACTITQMQYSWEGSAKRWLYCCTTGEIRGIEIAKALIKFCLVAEKR